MGIFEKMQKLTRGKTEEKLEKPIARPGDIIEGVISNIVRSNDETQKKGGYGFITSLDLPYERIYFHWKGLTQDTLRFPELKKRMKVQFRLKKDDVKGYYAIKVKVL